MKSNYIISIFAVFFSSLACAQELPAPNSLYVGTQCTVNEGYIFDDVVAEFRGNEITGTDGPNAIFFRQPIAGNNAAFNQFTRAVSWRDMEHWATSNGGSPSKTSSCDNVNRKFFINRVIGANRGAYSGTDNTLVSTRVCKAKEGYNISDVYQSLNIVQASREANGDTSVMHLSHLFLGPSTDTDMRSTFLIRLIGESDAGLARTLDAQMAGNVSMGSAINLPATCQNASLTRSYMKQKS